MKNLISQDACRICTKLRLETLGPAFEDLPRMVQEKLSTILNGCIDIVHNATGNTLKTFRRHAFSIMGKKGGAFFNRLLNNLRVQSSHENSHA